MIHYSHVAHPTMGRVLMERHTDIQLEWIAKLLLKNHIPFLETIYLLFIVVVHFVLFNLTQDID